MSTKILFLVPMHITFDSFCNPTGNTRAYPKKDGRYYNSLSTDLPLGPISISAYLKKHIDVDVKLIDFNVELNLIEQFNYKTFYDYCFDFLNSYEYDPDIIAISSLFSPSFANFMDCAKASKKVWPNSIIIGGGNIPTNDSKRIYDLEPMLFDALCYGEGEKPLLEALLSNDIREFFEKSNNWITLNKVNDISFSPKHNFIENLDEIPFFDYDLCDIERHGVNPATPSFEKSDQRAFHIMTSRGCPFLCTFCASHRTHGRDMRYHSIDRVREDLEKLKLKYGATKVIFQDDHLMADSKRVYDILDIVGHLELQSLYQNGLTLYALDRPMLEAFYKAGVRHLVLPVESGSEKVLKKQMRKPLKTHISERVAMDCRDLGIYTNANIIIGMPGETKADIHEGLENLKKVKSNWFNIACASPIVGSEMHELAQKKNYIPIQQMGSDFHHAVINTEDWTAEYIQEMEYIFNLELNFIHNNDIEFGDYKTALRGFNNVLRVREDHAFAFYFAGICYAKLGDQLNFKNCVDNFKKYSQSTFWKKYCDKYNLTIDSLEKTFYTDAKLGSDRFEKLDSVQANKYGP